MCCCQTIVLKPSTDHRYSIHGYSQKGTGNWPRTTLSATLCKRGFFFFFPTHNSYSFYHENSINHQNTKCILTSVQHKIPHKTTEQQRNKQKRERNDNKKEHLHFSHTLWAGPAGLDAQHCIPAQCAPDGHRECMKSQPSRQRHWWCSPDVLPEMVGIGSRRTPGGPW